LASGTVVSGGGTEVVSSGAIDDGASVQGFHEVYGIASGATLSGIGRQDVLSGGIASATTMLGSNSLDFVASGGTDVGAQISGGLQDVFGTASGATIYNSNASQDVESGGVASATTVSGGTEFVLSGGTDHGALISGGIQLVSGIASGATIYTAGSQSVVAGGVASATHILGGIEDVVGWPVETVPCNVPFARRSGIAFIGSAAHEPNRDAVQWLIEEIMPRVWERSPAIMCEIVGADWPDVFTNPLDHRIWLAGAVPELSTLFARVRLTVAPLRFGAGIKGKVLESLAAETPCVLTHVAAEGLPLTGSLRRLIGDTSDQIADLICDLHASASRNAKLGKAGRKMVAATFNFDRVLAELRPATVPAAPSARPGERRSA
jgi:autotransporter passenger strand-loop-strand repeat protein